MSMPSYWYDPIGGNAATGQPAMSADQINASMWGSYSPQQAQSTLDNIYGAQGFGGMTDYYSALGASYGRSTGGFGTPGSNPGWQAPNVGNVDAGKWGTMTAAEQAAHNQAVGRDEISQNLGNVPTAKWDTMTSQEKFDHNNAVKRDQGITPSQYSWSDYSPAPMGSTFDQSQYGGYPSGYVTPKSYLPPASPGDPYFMNSDPAGFNPSTSGGIGSDMLYGGQNPAVPRTNFNDMWQGPPPQVPVSPSTVTVPGQQGNLNWLNGTPPATS